MGVDEVSLEELNRFRPNPGRVPLVDKLPSSLGSAGGVTIIPLAM